MYIHMYLFMCCTKCLQFTCARCIRHCCYFFFSSTQFFSPKFSVAFIFPLVYSWQRLYVDVIKVLFCLTKQNVGRLVAIYAIKFSLKKKKNAHTRAHVKTLKFSTQFNLSCSTFFYCCCCYCFKMMMYYYVGFYSFFFLFVFTSLSIPIFL